MKELSPDEIKKIAQVPPEDYGAPPGWWLRANLRVAHEAHLNAVRQMVKWGDEDCPHSSWVKQSDNRKRRECGKCWQELKAQLEVKK